MLDLPAVTSEDHRVDYHIMKNLMKNEFLQLQESCYLKLIRNISMMDTAIRSAKAFMPPNGNVSVLPLPMTAFKGMENLLGESIDVGFFTDDILLIGELPSEEATG